MMKTTIAAVCLLAACVVQAVQQTVTVPSVGAVTLNAAKPGGWTFETWAEKTADGVDVVRVKMRAAKPETPPVFEVRWRVPQRDVHHLWTSESTHYGIPWSQPMLSEISNWMPLYSFLDANDANRFTFACSESCRRVEFRAPISEKGMDFGCVFRFFTVPEAPMTDYETCVRFDARPVFYGEAIGAAADWMCRAAGLEPLAAPESAFDPLYSTWYTFHQDVSSALVEEECALAAKLGMKTLITDDGWQIDLPLGNRAWGGYHLCGDWKPGRNFPDMAAHVRRVHEMGYKYMLWYSVPFVGDRSANFERFKGKYLPAENCCAGGWVLDPRFPEVREYLIQTYEAAVRDWDLDGFKFDFIGRFTLKEGSVDPAIAENYAGRDIKAIPVAVERLLTDVTARLKALKPEILVEFRQSYIGPCIRKFGNMIRATDCPLSMVENRTRITRLRLTSGRTAVHSDMLEWRSDETPESAARCILNSLFGVVQYSVRLKTLPEAHLRMLKHWIDFSQAHREALLKGVFRPHCPAADYPLLEGEGSTERVWGVYQENLTVPTGTPDRTVYVLNGANAASVVVDFAAGAQVEVFDTFGGKVREESVPAGVRRVAMPVSGYLKISFPKPLVILDTDMGSSTDDPFALELAVRLHKAGVAELAAVMIDRPGADNVAFTDAYLHHHGLDAVPIGTIEGKTEGQLIFVPYSSLVHSNTLTRATKRTGAVKDAVQLYLDVLKAAPDKSVELCAVGFFTNLMRLLDTPGGADLVARKVKTLRIMAGSFDGALAHPEYNVWGDIPSARRIFASWPTPIVCTPYEVGVRIYYPAAQVRQDFPAVHPMAKIYACWDPDGPRSKSQLMWDPMTVLGVSDERLGTGFFSKSLEGEVEVDAKGFTTFIPKAGGKTVIQQISLANTMAIRRYLRTLGGGEPKGLPGETLPVRILSVSTVPAGNPEGEFITLTNLSSTVAVDLSGYRVVASQPEEGVAVEVRLPAGTKLAPNGSLRLDRADHWSKASIPDHAVNVLVYGADGDVVAEAYVDSRWWKGACKGTGAHFEAISTSPLVLNMDQWRAR